MSLAAQYRCYRSIQRRIHPRESVTFSGEDSNLQRVPGSHRARIALFQTARFLQLFYCQSVPANQKLPLGIDPTSFNEAIRWERKELRLLFEQ